ncbi:hypothetical protein FMM55_06985 [Campylobacter sp. LR196d]|nr:hypothetical protein FMM55_06985 [Campylobacter sp. LR196d]
MLLASYTHLEFVRIHPFIDGNGITARLLVNLALLKAGFCVISIDIDKKAIYYEAFREYSLDKNTYKIDLFLINCVIERLEFLKDFSIKNK